MAESIESVNHNVLRRVVYGHGELRAGWRLSIFLAIVIALINASNLVFRRLLSGVDDATSFLVRELMDFLIFLLASWIMGRLERRTIADYGLPWRIMFRRQFWQGVLLGLLFGFDGTLQHGRELDITEQHVFDNDAAWRELSRQLILNLLLHQFAGIGIEGVGGMR